MIRLTRAQLREIDRRAVEDYEMPSILLMENAAIGATRVACEMLGGDCTGPVLILVGGGNNGGDGLAIARHLYNRGSDVTVALFVDPSKFSGDALVNYRIARKMRLRMIPADPERIAGSAPLLIVDALFGTGLTSSPREPFSELIRTVEQTRAPVLSVDLPSGLDCDTGQPLGPTVRATHTVTFVAEKTGFAHPAARPFLGQITVVDIGCPRQLVEQVAGASPAA